jgi:hypothetical protein
MKLMKIALHQPYGLIFLVILFACSLLLPAHTTQAQGASKTYVGAEICKGCHEKEHTSFASHSKMSSSFKAIESRKKGLTGEEIKKCYECHTTGYGKEGGFKSEAETPDLKNLGCESCHGPGSSHASSSNPKEIKRHLDTKDCDVCHDTNRVAAFNYKPVLFGGAH